MMDRNKISQLMKLAEVFIEIDKAGRNLTEEQADQYAQRAIQTVNLTLTKEELSEFQKNIYARYAISETHGYLLSQNDSDEKWYDNCKKDLNTFFWSRYKNYLIDEQQFSPNVVATLGEETLDGKIMNCLGNPNSSIPFLKRGLIIGEVQSGKTSTYIGLMCKAADAQYKVFILLTGTTESLRRQTQERVEEGFIGLNPVAEKDSDKRVGVGKDNLPIYAASLTSRNNDFTDNCNTIALSLAQNRAVVFVVKKNSTVLESLTQWLINTNADPATKKINLPLLLIDDEADNASINTSKKKEDPTKINKQIRALANVFTKSTYVGFTATPFANVFIDPETTEKMENSDLFPEDFISGLPIPSNYIGALQVFNREGLYYNQLNYIEDAGIEEDDGWSFYYKHKKEWDGYLPNSLTDAVYTFYLANAIRDLRGDNDTHRSMLINISRFVKVQKHIKKEIEGIHKRAYTAIKFHLSSDFDESMKDPILRRVYKDWTRYYSNCEFEWDDIVGMLYKSIENIQIKVVNSSKGSEKLVYKKDNPIRVIAIGGLALSRGLTLEGLVISYFYRNTFTYDVLMQMGRWFGYRKGYEDLFRIWISKTSAEWYSEIAEATEQLRMDMGVMQELDLKPKDFGIRVRNDSDELKITASNKMRNAADETVVESYFGNCIETPYLIYDSEIQKNNTKHTIEWLNNLTTSYKFALDKKKGVGKHHVFYDVNKSEILSLLRSIEVSKYSSDFKTSELRSFLIECTDKSIEKWNVAIMDGSKNDDMNLQLTVGGETIYKLVRNYCKFESGDKRISLGKSGKMGGPNDGLLGITDMNGKTSDEIIESAKEGYKANYLKIKKVPMPENSTYSSKTWFQFIEDRNPLLIVYFVEVGAKDNNQEKAAQKFRESMGGMPVVGFAMGFPKNNNGQGFAKSYFKVNKIYNWFEKDSVLAEGMEE